MKVEHPLVSLLGGLCWLVFGLILLCRPHKVQAYELKQYDEASARWPITGWLMRPFMHGRRGSGYIWGLRVMGVIFVSVGLLMIGIAIWGWLA
jgi:hypothetical protein